MSESLLTDDLWSIIAPLLPPEPVKPKGGRPRCESRAVLSGILHVLEKGIPWDELPKELGFGSGMTCWRQLRDWQQAGVWQRLQQTLVEYMDNVGPIDWTRVSKTSAAKKKNGGRRKRRVLHRGNRLRDYNRQVFAEKVRECLSYLGWRQAKLVRESGIDKGVLSHALKGRRDLPDADRMALIDLLLHQKLQGTQHQCDRREFLKIAGIGDYPRTEYAQKVREHLNTLAWTTAVLAKKTGIRRALLEKALQEEAERRAYLSEAQRLNIIDALVPGSGIDVLENSRTYNTRNELLLLAGLPVISITLPADCSSTNEIQDSENQAIILEEQQRWSEAEHLLVRLISEAYNCEDWPLWARCKLRAGGLKLSIGQLEEAQRSFEEVFKRPERQIGTKVLLEANVRMGWLHLERREFERAAYYLNNNQKIIEELNGDETLGDGGLHFLGRTMCEWGIQLGNKEYIEEGILMLKKAFDNANKHAPAPSMGYNFLRQVPALIWIGDKKLAENLLCASKDLLGSRGTPRGQLQLHSALLLRDLSATKLNEIIQHLQEALKSFINLTVWYPKGLADVFREMSETYIKMETSRDYQKALECALIATIFFPYGQNLEMLQKAAKRFYQNIGGRDDRDAAFRKNWTRMERELEVLEGAEFLDLKRVIESYSEEAGRQYITRGFNRALQTVNKQYPYLGIASNKRNEMSFSGI